MKNSIGRFKGIALFLLVSIVWAVVNNVIVIALSPMIIHKVQSCLGLVSCAMALNYMFKGYSKNAAGSFKAFMLTMFFCFQIATMGPTLIMNRTEGHSLTVISLTVAAHCVMASVALVLALAQDLGEKLSKAMGLLLLCFTAIFTIIPLLTFPGAARGGSIIGTAVLLRGSANLVMAETAMMMIYAKYADKSERGR